MPVKRRRPRRSGLHTALALDRRLHWDQETSILLIDRNNDLLFAPLLWIVANGVGPL